MSFRGLRHGSEAAVEKWVIHLVLIKQFDLGCGYNLADAANNGGELLTVEGTNDAIAGSKAEGQVADRDTRKLTILSRQYANFMSVVR